MILVKKLFGGIRMTWLRVILLAAGAGAFTAVMAICVPEGNSFHEIAVYPEAWVLFAIFIITNCETAKEAALKTFVFFLISQPLIYLIQVPFNWLGWGIFQYYRYWFIITLLTLPGAFIGWHIKRNDLLSGLILSVMLVLLTLQGVRYLKDTTENFPQHLISTLFCFGQIPLYVFGILQNKKARIAALGICLAALVFFGWQTWSGPRMDQMQLVELDTEKYPIDENWTVRTEDESISTAELVELDGPVWYLRLHLFSEDANTVILTDGEGREYTFTVRYEENWGIRILDEDGNEL